MHNELTSRFFALILGLLAVVSLVSWTLKKLARTETQHEISRILSARVLIWWVMCGIFFTAILTGGIGSIIVFAFTSFLLLREFITITPTRRGDHDLLFWVFFVILPMHYYVLAIGWYGMFVILIPVYVFLFLPIRMAIAGDPGSFLERASKIQWSLMICVYCVSHAPALLKLYIPGHPGVGARLLFFLVLVVQLNDLIHRIIDKWHGSHAYAPSLNRGLSWEGFAGGAVGSVVVGLAFYWATPFNPWQAILMSLLSAMLGNAGLLCYHAIRQERHGKGVVVVETHQSLTERLIALCVAAPVFFHFVRYYFAPKDLQMF